MNIDINKLFNEAKKEIGEEEYTLHFEYVFGKPVLNFAKTIVINLPESCYANCEYCIDKELRKNYITPKEFLVICENTFKQFPDINEISITGGTLSYKDFNALIYMIRSYYKNAKITWNTNGIGLTENYDIDSIKYINLHRNSVDDVENATIFKTNKPILSINEAKQIFGNKLYLRITVDENFKLEDYAALEIPLYINKLLPVNNNTEKVFNDTLNKISFENHVDIRRRNNYLTGKFKDVPIRICMGDTLASHVPGRYPVYLNVVIIHRSGIVCGSWYEDDKVLYKK